MDFKTLVKKTRSVRRFYESTPVLEQDIIDLIDLARLAPSGRNLQSLKYFYSNTKTLNDKIFPTLSWAGYLENWSGPEEGERPAAYILVLKDNKIKGNDTIDHGFAAQNILLGANEKGWGTCVLKSFDEVELSKTLNIPGHLEILLAIALGKPAENAKLEKVENGDIKYWRDEKGVMRVPKRSLNEIILD